MTNKALANAEFHRQAKNGDAFPVGEGQSYRPHIIRLKLRVFAALLAHVLVVFRQASKKQMVRSNAYAVIAMVKNIRGWILTVFQFPGNLVSGYRPSGSVVNLAVPVDCETGSPDPAFSLRSMAWGFINLGPKPLSNRAVNMSAVMSHFPF